MSTLKPLARLALCVATAQREPPLPMTKAPSKVRLRLAYSSSEADNTSNQHTSDIWQQLDLFAKPDALFFVAPDVYPIQALIDFLKSSHVKQIIDLRQLPHFLFGGTSRARFFDVLEKLKIDYFSLLAYSITSSELGGSGGDLIRQHLKTGPSLVFSDLEPDRDPDVEATTNNLRGSGVQFRLIYAAVLTGQSKNGAERPLLVNASRMHSAGGTNDRQIPVAARAGAVYGDRLKHASPADLACYAAISANYFRPHGQGL